jgi:acetyltransferase-like isoleucine patch superfamily enzyme
MKPVFLEVSIKENVSFGDNVKVVEPVNLYGCCIGNNCFIGPFVEIQKDVAIGNDCKIQSHTFICELVSIGNDCFIGHGVMFVNDLFAKGGPARGDKAFWKATKIGDHVSIGSNATILPIEICDNVVIGAGSVVTKNIHIPGVYAGNPAKLIRPELKKNSI